MDDDLVTEYLDQIRAASHVIPVSEVVDAVEADPDDNMFLACAIEAEANVIVSGDPHLKQLRSYRNVAIISPDEFLEFLRRTKQPIDE